MPIATIAPKHLSRLLVLSCIWCCCCWLTLGFADENSPEDDPKPTTAAAAKATATAGPVNSNDVDDDHDGLEITTSESEVVDSLPGSMFQQENGLWVLESFADLPQLLIQTTDENRDPHHADMVMLLVHGGYCSWTEPAIHKMEEAHEILYSEYVQKSIDNRPFFHDRSGPLMLAKMSYEHFLISNIENGKDLVDLQHAFETIPFVCFLVQDSHHKVEVLMWPSSSPSQQSSSFPSTQELVQKFRHYYHRLVTTTERVYASTTITLVSPASFPTQFFLGPLSLPSTRDVHDFVCQQVVSSSSPNDNDLGLLSLRTPAAAVIPPGTPNHERATLESMVPPHDQLVADDSVVFVQCRQPHHKDDVDHQHNPHENKQKPTTRNNYHSNTRSEEDAKTGKALYDAFSQLHSTMLPRANLLYRSASDCEIDGSVWAWRLSQQRTCSNDDEQDTGIWLEMPPFSNNSHSRTESALETLIQFHHIHASPSVMWYDPQIAAALAFPKFRKVHAFLFVDIHSPQLGEASQDFMQRQTALIQAFSSLCATTRRQTMERQQDSAIAQEEDLTCLIMPSTETRWLTTMDVDPWSAIDKKVMDLIQFGAIQADDDDTPLPRLVMTDRRRPEGGIVRYSLHNPTPATMHDFIGAFWTGDLQPDPKTAIPLGEPPKPKTATNLYGVQVIQGGQQNFADVIRENRSAFRHMFILFISPTCGHCKRLSSIFNRVAKLLYQQAAGSGWESLMGLYKLDVSSEDTTLVDLDLHFSVRWLPEIVYLSPHRDDVVYFNSPDHKKLAGELNHFSGLMEWILDVLDVPKAELSNLLAGVQKLQKARNNEATV